MSYITVGVVECPNCQAICSGHVITDNKISDSGWSDTSFACWCFNCKGPVQARGRFSKQRLSAELSR